MFENYDELNEMQIDVLREIGNIGGGNAASALASLLDKKVDMSLPKVRITGFDQAIEALGGAETMTVSVLVSFSGEAEGMIVFLINMEDAKNILSFLVGNEDNEDEDDLSDFKISAIKEIGNILAASYINSIADLTGLSINLAVPCVAIDMVGALMSVPIIEFGAIGDKLMFIEENFYGENEKLNSNIIMFTEINTLKTIMEKLGIELWVRILW